MRSAEKGRETGLGHGLEWKGENRTTADIVFFDDNDVVKAAGVCCLGSRLN